MNMEQTLDTGLEIAVIGMAGRFPGARNIEEYWENLKNGLHSVAQFSDKELLEGGITQEMIDNPNYVKAKGFLEDIEFFDPAFFGYKPSEAEKMDPQLRAFYQCTVHCLENAGYDPLRYEKLIGLYAGASPNAQWEILLAMENQGKPAESYGSVQLINKDYLATGISYKLNLKGPSFTLHTACSTSLVAIHLACQALLSGECDIALAGGVSITLPKKGGYFYQPGLIESPEGICRPFDKDASGTVFGNGVGIVALKAYTDAVEDGDTIHAVITGSAVNNDGNRKVGFAASSTKGQAEVIRTAHNAGEILPETLGYIETHGTGTELGDPIEIEALKLAFKSKKKKFCRIGSVKSNLGHLDVAAGVAGFIKTVFILKHKLIPPVINYKEPNPKIDFENSPFYINTRLEKWESQGVPLRAAISSFGVGGTNAHVVIQESPESTRSRDKSTTGKSNLIILSAKSASALKRVSKNLENYFLKNPDVNLADAAFTLQMGRGEYPFRQVLVGNDIKDALKSFSEPGGMGIQEFHVKEGQPPLVFMFPGQGSQYVNMGLQLYLETQEFREQVDYCLKVLEPIIKKDLRKILFPGTQFPIKDSTQSLEGHQDSTSDTGIQEYEEKIKQTEIAQVLIFLFEYALARMLVKWGIKPDVMIGHSIGEFTAACISGVFSLEDALSIVVLRGSLMQQMPPGKMVSLKLTEEQVREMISQHPGVEIAAINGPTTCVVTGLNKEIEEFTEYLDQRGQHYRLLHTSHAFHSQSMEPILEKFQEGFQDIQLKKPGLPFISNLTGQKITDEEAMDPKYWAKHLRNTVRFSRGLEELLEKSEAVFIEVGPGRTLSSLATQNPTRKPTHKMVNLIPHPKEGLSGQHFFLNKIGQLWGHGTPVDWKEFNSGTEGKRIPLPLYSFERLHFWKVMKDFKKNRTSGLQLFGTETTKEISDWFYRPCWKQEDLPPFNQDLNQEDQWILFMDQRGMGAKLADFLRKHNQLVRCICKGDQYQKQSDSNFIINPSEPDHYASLFKELSDQRKSLKHILYLWSIDGEDFLGKTHDDSVGQGFEDSSYILSLIKMIGAARFRDSLKLTVISDKMHQIIGNVEQHPVKTALTGLIKTIPQEYPNIQCKSIDLLLPDTFDETSDTTAEQLWFEVQVMSREKIVAYRNGLRWVLDYEPVKLEESVKENSSLKKNGVWLIFGDLGGIGTAIGQKMAEEIQARLILVDSTGFPLEGQWEDWLKNHDEEDFLSQKIKKIQAMKESGIDISLRQGDLKKPEEIEEILDSVDSDKEKIDGFIYVPGSLERFSLIPVQELKAEVHTQHLESIIQELHSLEQLFVNREINRGICISSLSAILGGFGFLTYSTENIVMDAFVRRHNRLNKQHWLTINLEAWLEGSNNQNAISLKKAAESVSRIVSWGNSDQVAVSLSDLKIRLLPKPVDGSTGKERGASGDESKDQLERPELSNPYAAPTTQMEKKLTAVIAEFFALKQVGIHDNFFDLGATSLEMVQLSEKLNGIFDTQNISVATLFRYPMISQLSKSMTGGKTQNKSETKERQQKKIAGFQKGRKSRQNRLELLKKR
jgi:polyketide synthase PksJ